MAFTEQFTGKWLPQEALVIPQENLGEKTQLPDNYSLKACYPCVIPTAHATRASVHTALSSYTPVYLHSSRYEVGLELTHSSYGPTSPHLRHLLYSACVDRLDPFKIHYLFAVVGTCCFSISHKFSFPMRVLF